MAWLIQAAPRALSQFSLRLHRIPWEFQSFPCSEKSLSIPGLWPPCTNKLKSHKSNDRQCQSCGMIEILRTNKVRYVYFSDTSAGYLLSQPCHVHFNCVPQCHSCSYQHRQFYCKHIILGQNGWNAQLTNYWTKCVLDSRLTPSTMQHLPVSSRST